MSGLTAPPPPPLFPAPPQEARRYAPLSGAGVERALDGGAREATPGSRYDAVTGRELFTAPPGRQGYAEMARPPPLAARQTEMATLRADDRTAAAPAGGYGLEGDLTRPRLLPVGAPPLPAAGGRPGFGLEADLGGPASSPGAPYGLAADIGPAPRVLSPLRPPYRLAASGGSPGTFFGRLLGAGGLRERPERDGGAPRLAARAAAYLEPVPAPGATGDAAAHLGQSAARTHLSNTEVASHVGLQQLLWANFWFDLGWLVATVISTDRKVGWRGGLVDPIRTIIIILFVAFEPLRLWLGYAGNLRERAPLLATFMLVSALPALPIAIYMGWLQQAVYPFDSALGTFFVALLGLQLVMGGYALRRVLASEELKFYLVDFAKDS